MSVELQWNGLEELREQLRQLPADLATQAGDIIETIAESAKNSIVGNYPQGKTGTLRSRVTLQTARSPAGVRAVIRSRAPHASIFEHGTNLRRTRTGANRGRMPAPPESAQMIPQIVRFRKQMYALLSDLLKRQGFEVSEA